MKERCGRGRLTTSSPAGPSPSPSTPSGLSHPPSPTMAGSPSSSPTLLLSHSLVLLSSYLRWGWTTILQRVLVNVQVINSCPNIQSGDASCPFQVAIGQYSGLATGVLFRHLFPLLAGLGLAVPLMAILRAMLDLGVLMWSALTFYSLFSNQVRKRANMYI